MYGYREAQKGLLPSAAVNTRVNTSAARWGV